MPRATFDLVSDLPFRSQEVTFCPCHVLCEYVWSSRVFLIYTYAYEALFAAGPLCRPLSFASAGCVLCELFGRGR